MDDFWPTLARSALTAAADSGSDRLSLSPNGSICIDESRFGSEMVKRLIEREALISFLWRIRRTTGKLLEDLGDDLDDQE
jgi:hypothetical protein